VGRAVRPNFLLCMEPEAPPFRLLHIERCPDHDRHDGLAFNAWLELNNLIELSDPCLFYLVPRRDASGFAGAAHAPRTHANQLLMTVVDQDQAHEDLGAFEERVRARAQRMVPWETLAAATAAPEPPAWTAQDLACSYEEADETPDYGDLEA
jgi:hypothetical protein